MLDVVHDKRVSLDERYKLFGKQIVFGLAQFLNNEKNKYILDDIKNNVDEWKTLILLDTYGNIFSILYDEKKITYENYNSAGLILKTIFGSKITDIKHYEKLKTEFKSIIDVHYSRIFTRGEERESNRKSPSPVILIILGIVIVILGIIIVFYGVGSLVAIILTYYGHRYKRSRKGQGPKIIIQHGFMSWSYVVYYFVKDRTW